MALDATPGSPSANAYLTVVQATAFLQERLHTEPWYSAQSGMTLAATREAALITATRLLDEQFVWHGTPSTTTQALDWPRTGVSDPHRQPLDATTVPVTIQRATAYYALALLRDTSESSTGVATGTVKRRQLGDTTIEYFQPGTGTVAAKPPMTTLPAEIRQMLKGWGLLLGALNVPLARA